MRFASRFSAALLLGAAGFLPVSAQTSPQAAPTPGQPGPTTTLSTGTQLVVVDVTVQDKNGNPIHDLKAPDFVLNENHKPQPIKTFEEHRSGTPVAAPSFPNLPPGTFTDYTNVPEDSTLNILLLDTLNTPMKDQTYVRYQLQQYVKKAPANTRIAIFGLNSHLILLQGFTSDPDTLKAAVEHRLIPRASPLLDDPAGTNTDSVSMSDMLTDAGASTMAIAGVQQFEAQTATFQTQIRVQYTIDAFNALGRYLQTFPGRKNLIWFSGSFPLTIFPDPDLDDPFGVQADFSDQLRETSGLLARARVAVYPIDARGLQTNPVMDASRSGAGMARNPGAFANATGKWLQQTASEHMSMDQVAEDTGGRAFYNTNGLAEAVTKAIESGQNYYTLTYSPANRNWNGDYRSIRLQLQGAAAARGLKLSYRHGYYADDPYNRKLASSVMTTAPANAPATGTLAYARASMDRGAPAPSEILFKVRVLPTSAQPEDTVYSHNVPNPDIKGPFRRYQVDYVALGNAFRLSKETDGKYHGQVEFVVFVYDSDGKLLNIDENNLGLSLDPATYANLLKTGFRFGLQVSTPSKKETFLRIAIHDVPSGRMGIVEVPSSSIEHLAPLPPDQLIPEPKPNAAPGPAPAAAPDQPTRRPPPSLGPETASPPR